MISDLTNIRPPSSVGFMKMSMIGVSDLQAKLKKINSKMIKNIVILGRFTKNLVFLKV